MPETRRTLAQIAAEGGFRPARLPDGQEVALTSDTARALGGTALEVLLGLAGTPERFATSAGFAAFARRGAAGAAPGIAPDTAPVFVDFIEGGYHVTYVLFADGSGFFADQESEKHFALWPIDFARSDPPVELDEFTPFPDSPGALVADLRALGGRAEYAVLDSRTALGTAEPAEARAAAALAAQWHRIAAHMHNPPEPLRAYLAAVHQDFAWSDPGARQPAEALVAQAAIWLEPDAREVRIHAGTAPGKAPVERRSDADMQHMRLSALRHMSDEEEIRAVYSGDPYAEISAPQRMSVAADGPLAWISRAILTRLGAPTGWHVEYNDGAALRMSGHTAHPETVEIDLGAQLSAHARLAAGRSLAAWLRDQGLLAEFQKLLADHGLEGLPQPG